MYDLIVIGAGAAGLTAAGFMGRVGGKVALIERNALGGDCTWVGCVPSKALLKVSKIAHSIRTAEKYGIQVNTPNIDMPTVKIYVQQAIQEIYQHETPEVFAKAYNVEVILGEARFVDPHTVQVNGQQLKAKKFIIATGARPTIPPISGLDEVSFFTNRTIFDNDHLPKHLLIMGAGAIGVEMGQAYARLGAQVTLMDERLLPREEPEVSSVMEDILAQDGVMFIPSLVDSVEKQGEQINVILKNGDMVSGDMLLVAVGRTPNTDLGLDYAGVAYDKHGIIVDKYLRTTVKHIYAVGDCTSAPKFTHYAGFQGSIAGRNATLPILKSKGHDPILPRVIFTDPEVAHVGLNEDEARKIHGDSVKTFIFPLSRGDRAVAEDDRQGFVKLIYKGGGSLLGATVVSDRAGEMIMEYMFVLKNKLTLRDISTMIHPYPTYADIVKKATSTLVIEELFRGFSGRMIKLL
ncbi:MAG: FAD-binding protein, partial [Chloroflexi bacterium]